MLSLKCVEWEVTPYSTIVLKQWLLLLYDVMCCRLTWLCTASPMVRSRRRWSCSIEHYTWLCCVPGTHTPTLLSTTWVYFTRCRRHLHSHPSSTISIFLFTTHQPLFKMCITSPVESAPFFIPSTSFCSLSTWFTSSCVYHFKTVTTFALNIYHLLSLSLQT